jgi:hypothetical protein
VSVAQEQTWAAPPLPGGPLFHNKSRESFRDMTDFPSPFSPAEHAIIRHTAQDWAGRWYGKVGPFTFGRDDAARYVSEGYLRGLCERYSLKQVWEAVAAEIEAAPEVLETRHSDAEIDERQAARRSVAAEIDKRAEVAFRAADFDGALALLDEAELAAPDYTDFDGLREFVRSRRG